MNSSDNEKDKRPSSSDRATPPLDDLYREVVLDHYRHPRGREELHDPNVSVQGYNPTCGDQVHVALALEGDRIREAQVECQGCSISVASGSMMAELLSGKTREEVDQLAEGFKAMMHGREAEPGLDLGDLEALEGVRQFPVRIKCALLAWTTLQEALAAFAPEKEGQDHADHS
jgi:nitrogen fixation NifU-like protein